MRNERAHPAFRDTLNAFSGEKATLEKWDVNDVNAQLVIDKARLLKRCEALEKQADGFREEVRELRNLCDSYRRDKNKWQDIAMSKQP